MTSTTPPRSTARAPGNASSASRCRCSLRQSALRIFDLPYVLTRGSNNTTTLSLLAHQELTSNRLIGYGSALSVLTFVIVMAVSFLYIRTVGGNIRSLAEEG